jgi:hypothetical protein
MMRTAQLPRLTAGDRCDRCGAQAYVQVELLHGAELLFCAHHGHQYHAKLREVALLIHDESDRLTEPEPPAPVPAFERPSWLKEN